MILNNITPTTYPSKKLTGEKINEDETEKDGKTIIDSGFHLITRTERLIPAVVLGEVTYTPRSSDYQFLAQSHEPTPSTENDALINPHFRSDGSLRALYKQ